MHYPRTRIASLYLTFQVCILWLTTIGRKRERYQGHIPDDTMAFGVPKHRDLTKQVSSVYGMDYENKFVKTI